MREAGRKALMPMLPDTLGTKSFFRQRGSLMRGLNHRVQRFRQGSVQQFLANLERSQTSDS